MGIPQIIYVALASVALLISARMHGTPKTGKNNFWSVAIGISIQVGLMAWGGFFGQ